MTYGKMQVDVLETSAGRILAVDAIPTGGEGAITFPVANQTKVFLRGDNTFTNTLADSLKSIGTGFLPGLLFGDTVRPVNEKNYGLFADGSTLALSMFDDIFSLGVDVLRAFRTGMNPTKVEILPGATGRVLIGTTTDNGADLLQVAGNIFVGAGLNIPSTARMVIAPNQYYDLAAGALATSIVLTGVVTPGAGKQHNLITARPTPDLTAAGSSFRAYDFDITLTGCAATSEGNGVIGAIHSGYAGVVKAIYGRAGITGTGTGVAVGLVGAVESVATAAVAWACQLSVQGPSGALTSHIVLQGDAVNDLQNGIVADYNCLFTQAVLQWNQAAGVTGDFLRVWDSGISYKVFAVDVNGNVTIGKAGSGIKIKEGTNARSGVATLGGGTGTAVVSNTTVTANTRILLTVQSLGTVTAPKAVAVTARTPGTSFTITSSDTTDTSVVHWELKEPA